MTNFVLDFPDYQISSIMSYFYSRFNSNAPLILSPVILTDKLISFVINFAFLIFLFLMVSYRYFALKSCRIGRQYRNDLLLQLLIMWIIFSVDSTEALFVVICWLLVIFQFCSMYQVFRTDFVFMDGAYISFKIRQKIFVVAPLIS